MEPMCTCAGFRHAILQPRTGVWSEQIDAELSPLRLPRNCIQERPTKCIKPWPDTCEVPMSDVYVVSAKRTPIGKFGRSLAKVRAPPELGAAP